MHPYFFHTAAQPLLGLYGPPQSAQPRNEGVLLCSPVGHEYVRCYRALKQLGDQLMLADFHVFRFDFSCLGDSWGSFEEASLQQWRSDLATALREFQDSAGIRNVHVVGLRLGATLAWDAALDNPSASLVLWDPVIQGTAWLETMRAIHRQLPIEKNGTTHDAEDLLGFTYTDRLKTELRAIDLLLAPLPQKTRLHLLFSAHRPENQALTHRLTPAGAKADYLDEAFHWDEALYYADPLVAGKIPRAIVDLLEGKE